MKKKAAQANWLLGLVGAAVGGGVGYAIALYLGKRGMYMPALPGVLLGLGCGLLSRGRSLTLGIVCGVLGLVLGVVSQWHIAPFRDDAGLGFFVTHAHQLGLGVVCLILLGALFAAWAGMGRRRYVVESESSPE